MSRQYSRHPNLLKCCVTTRPTDPDAPIMTADFMQLTRFRNISENVSLFSVVVINMREELRARRAE